MKCRILVVEDSATQAEALRTLLEEAGNRVTVASSAEAALDRLGSNGFDLVLSDVMMPGITGYELCRRIKGDPRTSGLPVILLTSLVDPMDIVRGLEAGADNYITKPYDPEHLLTRLRNVLDNRRLRRDAKTSVGVTVRFMGRDLLISSEREQILDLFISSVEDIVRTNEALQRSQRELSEAHRRLDAYARAMRSEAKASSHRYRALLEGAENAIFVLDLEGRILDCNPRAVDLLGRTGQVLHQQSLLDLIEAEERRELSAALSRLAKGEAAWEVERAFTNAAGNEVWFGITASRTDVEGTTLVLLIIRNLTAQRRAEESLRDRERQLREAQHIANIGSFEHSLTTGRRAWSDQLFRILGRPIGERVNYEELLEQVHPEDVDRLMSALQAAMDTLEPVFVEFRIRRVDGTERVVQGRGSVERGPDGTGGRLVGTLQDVTERKEAERAQLEREEAERANRAKSEFLSRMSHELRTPLNAILGFGQLLAMDEMEAEAKESVDQILRAGGHLLQLINEVLDLTRIEAGKLSLSLEPVALDDVIFEALALMEPVARQAGITLSANTETVQGVFLRADVQRLKQILLNFISNGIKYNRPRGRVRILGVPAPKRRYRIIVEDTGPGLGPDEMQKLFTPFQRLSADAEEIEGTGLGLTIAKGLTEVMGGSIGAESEVGKGSRFWVEIPEAGPVPELVDLFHDEAGEASLAQTELTGAHTILYIEDNPSNLRLVERVLARPGIQLLSAMQGRLGMELAREHRPDLILLDLNLPDLSGEDILNNVQSDPATKHIPVVVLSADAIPGQAERLKEKGAVDYVTKPIDVHHFTKTIYAILEQAVG